MTVKKTGDGMMKKAESGRSTVEILGALAIIGVLSIGGIAGYRYATDKMNANIILSEIGKRALTASQQKLLGRPINLTEYGSPDVVQGYVVGHNDEGRDATFFSLSVSGVPKGICDKVVQDKLVTATRVLAGETDVTEGGPCPNGKSRIKFIFADTLDTDKELGEGIICEPACPDEQTCQSGTCVCPTDKPVWDDTLTPPQCREKRPDNCTINGDCKDNQYCAISATYKGFGKGDNGTCYSSYTGTCKNRVAFTEDDKIELQASDEAAPYATVYKVSTTNWWSAVNYCASQKNPVTGQPMSLFDVSNNRLKCSKNSLGVSGTSNDGYCYLSGTGSDRSLRLQAFQNKLGNVLYWTNALYNDSGSATCTIQNCNSCAVFAINAKNGKFDSSALNGSGFVLCE